MAEDEATQCEAWALLEQDDGSEVRVRCELPAGHPEPLHWCGEEAWMYA